MEPLSPQLRSLIGRLGLATNRDLRRCRPIVRRLARDLPTFDSIWIDALTQTRVLTPFQARVLESDRPERLEVGPCVLIDEIERDGLWTLYAARHRNTRRKCLLTYVNVTQAGLPQAQEGVSGLLSKLRGLSHSSLILPRGCDTLGERLIVVSPFAAGPTLQQLLIRRGRFPIPVVRELARQILDGLAVLEQRSVCHGDLRLNTVRLNARGQSIQLNAGVLPAIGIRVSFHDARSADSYDGMAPELISTGENATVRSDLYALGCLLWQLLAGRSPFPTGDPLAKLAAHQSRVIDDVQRWRPDAPDDLRELIAKLTIKDPQLRPSGPGEVRDAYRLSGQGRRTRLSSFHASFGAVAPRHSDSHRSASRFPWTVAATLLLVLSGFSLTLVDAGARSELLRLATRIAEPAGATAQETTPPQQSTDAILPLPVTPLDGVIELAAGAVYLAADLTTNRPLSLRCTGGLATILVGEEPLRITAQDLELRGIRFAAADSDPSDANSTDKRAPQTLLVIRSQRIAVSGCRFERRLNEPERSSIAWKIRDESDPSGGRFVARDSMFLGDSRGLDVYSMPRIIGFDNCLKRGAGTLVRFAGKSRGSSLRMHLRKTTLRDSGPLLQWTAEAAAKDLQPALVVVENSVFSFASASDGVLDFLGQPASGWERSLRITGEGSLLHSGAELVTAQTPVEVSSDLRIEGLLIDDFEFAGNDRTATACRVTSTQAPRSSVTPPGIDATRLPHTADLPVVQHATGDYNRH